MNVTYCSCCGETVKGVRQDRAEQTALNCFVREAYDVWPKDELFVIGETEVQPS